MWRSKGGMGSLKSQPPLITVIHPMLADPPLELTAVFHANSISIVAVEIFVAFVAG